MAVTENLQTDYRRVSRTAEQDSLHRPRRTSRFQTRSLFRFARSSDVLQQEEQFDVSMESNIGSMEVVCRFCLAYRWSKERSSICCRNGKIVLPPLPELPSYLKSILNSERLFTFFTTHSRQLNNALALASQVVKQVLPSHGGRWTPTVTIQGRLYHCIGDMQPGPDEIPKFLQLYLFDPSYENEEIDLRIGHMRLPGNMSESDKNMLRSMVSYLQGMLRNTNAYVRDLITALDICAQNVCPMKFVLNADAHPSNQHERRYNLPQGLGLQEISVLIGDDAGPRDIVVHMSTGGIKRIHDTHRSFDPLHFVLLFPYGTDGWHLCLPHNTGCKNVTPTQYYSYRLLPRQNEAEKYIFQTRKLFQEYCCMAYAKSESQRLRYISTHQKELRAELYHNLCDALHASDVHSPATPIGRKVILPASFTGSPRDMHRRYQDAMAIVRKYGKPDLFITFTCNPKWVEIREALMTGQSASDRPDIVSRVFALKVNELIHDVSKKGIFGRVVAFTYTVEFQKRGLPHIHLLLILHPDQKIRSEDDVDRIVCAEIPPPNSRLRDIVTRNMIHSMCGDHNPNSPCMKENKCSKGFPKDFSSSTFFNENNSYPVYRRRCIEDGGHGVELRGTFVDNEWVVPYNPFLCLKYNSHINVEMCNSVRGVKYLFKYVYKGHDRSMVHVGPEDDHNEVKQYCDMRCVSASEACWRIFEIPMSGRAPSVTALPVHLPNQQIVYFEEGYETQIAQGPAPKTALTQWFALNSMRNGHADTSQILYCDMPQKYRWDTAAKLWKKRKYFQRFPTIGRVHTIHPAAGDVFYLRILLHHVPGATSYSYLRTLDGTVFPSFKEACHARGLLSDDCEWDVVLTDATSTQSSKAVRELFCMILIHCNPADSTGLFDRHIDGMTDDIMYGKNMASNHAVQQNGNESVSPVLRHVVIHMMESFMKTMGKTLVSYGFQTLSADQENEVHRILNSTPTMHRGLQRDNTGDEDIYDIDLLKERSSKLYDTLLPSQARIVDQIVKAVDMGSSKCFFVDAPGGTGKTYCFNLILDIVRSKGHIAIAVASSGIAACLLHGGRTFHSQFKAPLKPTSTSTCNIPPRSKLAELLRKADLIIWDEATMSHKFLFEALNRSLNDLTGKPHASFGNKVIVLGGDFRQTLPVIKHGSRSQIVDACIKRSSLWSTFTTLRLHENMRVMRGGGSAAFTDWLMSLGNGEMPHDKNECVTLKDEMVISHLTGLKDWVYNGLAQNFYNMSWLAERAILAPRNDCVDEINDILCAELPGTNVTRLSADTVDDPGQSTEVPIEYLNSLTVPGMPPHKLNLKKGIILILLRNMSDTLGLCNGTRLILRDFVGQRLLKVEIASGNLAGRTTLLPRIKLQPPEGTFPFLWTRLQFPVRLAFAMTINKAQGQSLRCAGVMIEQPVFSHGQLYVAASRVGSAEGLRFSLGCEEHKKKVRARNVVYKEVLC